MLSGEITALDDPAVAVGSAAVRVSVGGIVGSGDGVDETTGDDVRIDSIVGDRGKDAGDTGW